MIFSGQVDNICNILLCLIASWFSAKRTNYVDVHQCVVRRIFGFVIIVVSSYPLFVTMMVCEKKAFCPDQIVKMYNPDTTSIDFDKLHDDISCRNLSMMVLGFINSFAVIFTIICIITKTTYVFIKQFKASSEPNDTEIEMHQLPQSANSAPLPPFTNTNRLHQSTIVVLIFLSFAISLTHIVAIHTKDLPLSLCVTLALTLLTLLLPILIEKRILCFCFSLFLATTNNVPLHSE